MTGVPARHGDTQGEGHGTTEAEVRVLQLEAKEHQELPGTTRRWGEA